MRGEGLVMAMDIQRAIIKASKASLNCKLFYSLLNKAMIKKLTRQQKTKSKSMVNVKNVLRQLNLEMIETEFFREKKTIFRVKDAGGKKFILKTGGIEPFQVKLLETAKAIENKLLFKVPVLAKQGEGWILLEEIEGKLLNDFYEEKPEWCAEISKKVTDDYQLVIQEIQKSQNLGNLLVDGEKWLYSRLNLWSKPIVDAKLINFSLIKRLKSEFKEIINQKGGNFFGWVHGNVIGDHLLVSGDDIYLLDLNAVPRAGKGYHDFLRALDFMFLKAQDDERIFTSIPRWMKQHLSEFDKEEIKLVFAFRSIGILGWDILHHKVEYAKGDLEKKKQLILKFIKREYEY